MWIFGSKLNNVFLMWESTAKYENKNRKKKCKILLLCYGYYSCFFIFILRSESDTRCFVENRTLEV